MAEYQWTPGADVVDVFVPVGIPNVRAVAANDEWADLRRRRERREPENSRRRESSARLFVAVCAIAQTCAPWRSSCENFDYTNIAAVRQEIAGDESLTM